LAAVRTDSLGRAAARLGLPADENQAVLAERVQDALRERFPGIPLAACRFCGFRSPDVPEVADCPGCGVTTTTEEEQMMMATPTHARAPVSAPIQALKPKLKTTTQPAVAEVLAPPPPEKDDARIGRLRELEKTIDALKGQSGVIEWETGRALNEIKNAELWRADSDAATFDGYVKERFRFTPQTAVNYIKISCAFTREQAARMRVTDMRYLIRLPDDDRGAMIKEVLEGPERSTRELAAAIKAKKIEAGLQTARGGFEDTVLINKRYRLGEAITGSKGADWEQLRDPQTGEKFVAARVQIGETVLLIECVGAKWEQLQGAFIHVTVPRDQTPIE
jgi:hypothetical protein